MALLLGPHSQYFDIRENGRHPLIFLETIPLIMVFLRDYDLNDNE